MSICLDGRHAKDKTLWKQPIHILQTQQTTLKLG